MKKKGRDYFEHVMGDKVVKALFGDKSAAASMEPQMARRKLPSRKLRAWRRGAKRLECMMPCGCVILIHRDTPVGPWVSSEYFAADDRAVTSLGGPWVSNEYICTGPHRWSPNWGSPNMKPLNPGIIAAAYAMALRDIVKQEAECAR